MPKLPKLKPLGKPRWAPDVPRDEKGHPVIDPSTGKPKYRLCPCCAWRLILVTSGQEWCPTCLSVATSLGGPKPPLPRLGVRAKDANTDAGRARLKTIYRDLDSLIAAQATPDPKDLAAG